MLSIHIHSNITRPSELFQLTLEPGRTAEVVQAPDNPEHGGECSLAHIHAEALMRSKTEVKIRINGAIKLNLIGIGECDGIVTGGNLKKWLTLSTNVGKE